MCDMHIYLRLELIALIFIMENQFWNIKKKILLNGILTSKDIWFMVLKTTIRTWFTTPPTLIISFETLKKDILEIGFFNVDLQF